jgi:5'-3' exonuclease
MSSLKKTDHFYLIDGSGYIFRAYYALPPLSRKSDGLPTGAVSGFCSMLFKLLEDARSDDSKQSLLTLLLSSTQQEKILEMIFIVSTKLIELKRLTI